MTNEPPPDGSAEFADFFHTDELPTGPLPRQSHRGERRRTLLENKLVAPLTAVLVVVVVILLLIWINGKPSGKGPGPGVIAAPKTSPSVQVTHARPTHHATPVSSARPVHTASTGPTPSAGSRVSPSASATPAVTSSPVSAADRNATAPVQVLNNSTISGLAARVAAELRGKHWKITAVGNLQGEVAETTVYYPAGQQAAAKHLAREFPSIRQVAPSKSAKLPGHGDVLILVVTRDWSG